MGDSSSSDSLSGGAFRSDQSQKRSQLPDMAQITPVAYSCQKLGTRGSADSRDGYQILKASLNLWILVAEAKDFLGRIFNLCLRKAQSLYKPAKLKVNRFRAGKHFQLSDRYLRPLRTRKGKAFQQQKRFNAALGGSALLNEGISQLSQMAQLPIRLAWHMDALKLTTAKALRQLLRVQAVCLDTVTGSLRHHRRGNYQARISCMGQIIMQAKTRWACFIDKGYMLSRELPPYKLKQPLRLIRHP
jgi:hypothetical protein